MVDKVVTDAGPDYLCPVKAGRGLGVVVPVVTRRHQAVVRSHLPASYTSTPVQQYDNITV